MIYRLKSKLAIHDRIEAFVIGVPGTDKQPLPSGPKTYEANFRVVDQITLPCTVCEAPDYEQDRSGVSLVLNRGKEGEALPDIWTHGMHLICSEKFKAAIYHNDAMQHQFIPIQILNEDFVTVEKEQAYYWLNVKRFVRIKGEFDAPEALEFFPIPGKEDFLSQVRVNKALYEGLSTLPIWRYSSDQPIEDRAQGLFSVLYLGEALYEKCRQAGITGMDLYSAKYGVGEESLTAIRFQEK